MTMLSLWVIWLTLKDNLGTFTDALEGLEPKGIFASLMLVTFSLFIVSVYHALLVTSLNDGRGSRIGIIAAYTQGQVIKYLPGKIWGIVSQALRLKHYVEPRIVWEAVIIQLLITQINSIAIIMAVGLFIWTGNWILACIPVLVVFCLFPLLSGGYISSIIQQLVKRLPLKNASGEVVPWKSTTGKTIILVGLLNFEWVIYYLAWIVLAADLDTMDVIYIATLYAAASIMGVMAFVMPAGLLVREASFIGLGTLLTPLSAEMLLAYSIVFRVLYIVADMMLYVVTEILLAMAPDQTLTQAVVEESSELKKAE
jgi:hypothetical protein